MKKLFRSPLGYPEAVLLQCGLFLVGWGLHLATDQITGVTVPGWPVNVQLLTLFLLILTLLTVGSRKSPLLAWLASVPVSLCSMGYLGVLALVAGILPQDGSSWMNQMTSSWPFALVVLLLLTNLGMATLRRVYPFRRQNIGFLLNHGGLWIVAAAMAFGGGDFERLRMPVREGETTSQAYAPEDENQAAPVTLPFSVLLKDFRMEEYPPRIGIYNRETGESLLPRAAKLLEVKKGAKGRLGSWDVEVLEYLPSAAHLSTEQGFGVADGAASVPAAKIRVSGKNGEQVGHAGRVFEGWVSLGNDFQDSAILDLGPGVIAMTEPAAKLYRSDVSILEPGKAPRDAVIEVNKPVAADGWRLYQTSYDARMGKYSVLSVLDAVRDPWLPVAYTGMGLLLLGMIHLFWTGIKIEGERRD